MRSPFGNDTTHTVNVPDASRFVRPNGLIVLRVKKIVIRPFTLNGFHSLEDLLEIRVRYVSCRPRETDRLWQWSKRSLPWIPLGRWARPAYRPLRGPAARKDLQGNSQRAAILQSW